MKVDSGQLLNALVKTHNDLMLRWQITESGPEADVIYKITEFIDSLVHNLEEELSRES